MKRLSVMLAAIAVLAVAGCRWGAAPPEPPEQTTTAAVETAPVAQPVAPVAVAAVPGPEKRDVIGDAVLQYADWLYFAAYCAVVMIAAWYVKKTGHESETLQKVRGAVGERLTVKHRLLFRILRWIYKKKRKAKK